ncbi:MAG: asparagine synthase (glutamine-hydrolyzing) [Crocinitomicaceae bacterium]
MCGIAGIWAKKSKALEKFPLIDAAINTIKHRVPDNTSCKTYTNCALGHTRLAIIDCESRSNQPFESADGRYALVFNGEIYNFIELKADLEKLGVQFVTTSDTEVLLYHLIHFGEDGLEKINGFYAFAFYDNQEDRLILARDKAGIKPLLYLENKEMVCFASEMTSIRVLNNNLNIDKTALNLYFSLTYTAAPNTIYDQIKVMLPGEVRVYEKKSEVQSQTLFVNHSKYKGTYEEACELLKEKLTGSVHRRMVADVPLGTFLSGGLDSSIVSAIAKEHKIDLKTFSIAFDHPYFNESKYSTEVSKYIESQHHEYLIDKQLFRASFRNFLDALDQPFADSSAFAMYLLAQKTKREVYVVLSGDGADELFAGYRKHQAMHIQNQWEPFKKSSFSVLAAIMRPFPQSRDSKFGEFNRKLQLMANGVSLPEKDRYFKWCQFVSDSDRKNLLGNSYEFIQYPYKWEGGGLEAGLDADQKLVLPNDMLKKVDAMSMAFGLEVRTPFLDAEVISFANSLPLNFKIHKKQGKRILRDTFKEMIPNSISTRSKKGFEIPLAYWLGEELEEQFESERFSSKYIKEQGLFDVDFIENLKCNLNTALSGDRIYIVWALIVFQFWWEKQQKNQ